MCTDIYGYSDIVKKKNIFLVLGARNVGWTTPVTLADKPANQSEPDYL